MTYSTYRKESITYNNNLNFQIIDINGNDEFLDTDLLYNDDIGSDSDDSLSDHDDNDYSNKQMKYIINMYGVDSNSQSIYVKIHDFKPYFYIEVPETWTNSYINEFKKFINHKYTDDALKFNKIKYKYDYSKLYEIRKDYLLFKSEYLGMKIVKKKKLYFFNNYKKFNFIRLTFSTKRALYSFKNFVDKDVIFDFKYKNKQININHKFAQYEANIDPCIRFIHEQNIEPSNWVSIKNYLNYPEDLSPTSCQFNCSTTNIHVVPYSNDSIAPLIIASFDIECTSESGAFPNAENDLDKIIQIGTVFSRYGETSPFLKTMITLGNCSPIDNCKLYQCMTEKEVLLKWTKLMCDVSPDIVTGYNIFGFDYKYMYARAVKFKIEPKFSKFSKLLNKSSRLDIKKLSSSALGDNTMYVPDTPGTVQLDLMKVIQADHNLNSYKLDNVASTFMRGKITKYVPNDNSTTIFTNNLGNLINNNYITIATQIDMYLEGKKFKINNITKLDKGGSFEIDYVINDDLVSISWTEAKDDVSPQEIFDFYKSGDPDKIKDVAVYCIQDCELCIRLINKLSIVSNKIGMANVCSVPLSYLFLRGQGVKIFSLIAKQCMNEHFVVPVIEKSDDNSGYEGAIVLIAKHGIYLDNPIAVVDYSSLYPSSMISENLSHDSIVWIYTESNGISTYTPENWEKYDNLDGYEYETIEYDLFETGSDGEKVKTGLQRCRYVQPLKNDDGEYINESRAIMPRILQKLLKARKDTRKKIPSEPDPFKKDVLNGLQLAYKVTCNSLYGQLGARTSPVFFKEIAASTTATGRKLLKFAKDQVESKFQGEFEVNGEKVGVVTDVVYGDSVLGDTPLILRDKKTHFVTIKTIDSLNNNWIPYENFKPLDTNISNKQQTTSDFEIWVENKWVDIKRVIRHKTNKSIYRVLTHVGVVDVTEDHSLIHENYSEIKPNELIVNKTPLLHGFPYNDLSNYIFDEQLILFIKKNISSKKYIKTTNKLTAQNIYIYLLQYYQFVYIDCNHDEYCIFVSTSKLNNINIVKKIIKLDNVDDKTYVYDIETSSGKFNGGVGQLVLKNTDSTFNRFRVYKNGKEILKKDALPYCIKLGQMAGEHVTKQLKHPHDLEYEKTFYPFILFSKKRYVGELYELDPNKISYRNSMGIVLKRRDNAPVLKKIYGDIIDTIMTKQDLKLSERIIKDEVEKLLNGEYPLSNFIISKTLKSNYKNPQSIAHVVLADRITQRDPGNAPQSNDRIPYIYIKIDDSKIKKQKIMKIGDLITEYRNIIKNLTDLEKKYKNVDILLDKINNVSLMGNKNEPEKDNNTYFIIRDLLRTAVEKSHSSNKLLQSFQSLIFEICKKKVKIVQGDRIESPEYIKQNSNIEIDYNFYLTNQVLKPVSQIFALEIEQLDGFSPSNFKENKRQEYTADLLFKKMIDKYKRKNINTLDNYFFIKS